MSSAPFHDVDSLPVLLPQRSVGYGSSLHLAGEQGEDLYASLLETSVPDLMGTSLSQMQDIMPLQTYGSIGMSGLPIDGEEEAVLGHASRASNIGEPLERRSPSNGGSLDLRTPRYSWVPSASDDVFHHGMMPSTSTADVISSNVLIRSGDSRSDIHAKVHPMVPVSLNVHTLHKPSWMDSEQEDDETMHMLPRTPMAGTSYAGNEENQGVVFDGAGRMIEVSDDDSGEFLEQGKYSSHSSMNIKRVPLAVALLNLQCLHAGASLCYQNAWKGCPAGDWCSMEPGHLGFCNEDARVPGPGAYMPEELENVSLKTLDGSWMDVPLSKAAKDLANSMRGKSLEQACSMDVPAEKVQAVRKSNRRRAKPKVDDEDGYLFGASDDSVVSGEVQLSHAFQEDSSVNQAGQPVRGGRGRKENHPAIPIVSTRSSKKKATKRPIVATKKTRKGGRLGVRKPPQIWVKGTVQDPRSGQMISDVPPGIFCTQCSATTTPVWRAGPFGHKTLCNACGVRWMKVDPKRR